MSGIEKRRSTAKNTHKNASFRNCTCLCSHWRRFAISMWMHFRGMILLAYWFLSHFATTQNDRLLSERCYFSCMWTRVSTEQTMTIPSNRNHFEDDKSACFTHKSACLPISKIVVMHFVLGNDPYKSSNWLFSHENRQPFNAMRLIYFEYFGWNKFLFFMHSYKMRYKSKPIIWSEIKTKTNEMSNVINGIAWEWLL